MAENWTFATSGSLGGLVPVLQPRSGGFKQQNAPRMRMGGGFCAHSPPRSFSNRAARPTRQLYHNDKNAEQFVSRSMRTKGLVPTLPDGSQPRPQSRPTSGKRDQKLKKETIRRPASAKVAKEIDKLSSEYIDNLQLQIQVRRLVLLSPFTSFVPFPLLFCLLRGYNCLIISSPFRSSRKKSK